MKKINNNIPLSNNQILNKYILSYTEPDYRIKELDCTFLRYIVKTKNKELIDYIFTKYYKPETIINHKTYTIKELAISQGYFIDEFLKQNDSRINYTLVYYNYKHDILYKDSSHWIRRQIAQMGNYLKELSDDHSSMVRYVVAEKGLYHEKFYKDEDPTIRQIVAKQGNFHEKLYKDVDYRVRKEVAKHGKYLDKLVNDKDARVRFEVAKHGKHNDKLINDKSYKVRLEIANQGQYLHTLYTDKNPNVRLAVISYIVKHKNKFKESDIKKYTDILYKDDNKTVRATVAHLGHHLDTLHKDNDWFVRIAVARQGKYLDSLKNDNDINVRYMAQNIITNEAI